MRPPREYYHGVDKLWRLRRPLYGLRTAPKHWQEHFAEVFEYIGGRRLKSEANVYYFEKTSNYVLVYVDDVMILGKTPQSIFDLITKHLLLIFITKLDRGVEVKFLGRLP